MSFIVVSTICFKNGFSWKNVHEKRFFKVAFKIQLDLERSQGNCHLILQNFIPLHQSLIYTTSNLMANLNRLKLVLVEKDKTGKWLSEQLGKSTCTVSKWCKNTVQPDLNTLDKIAKLLDVDVKDLLNSTEK